MAGTELCKQSCANSLIHIHILLYGEVNLLFRCNITLSIYTIAREVWPIYVFSDIHWSRKLRFSLTICYNTFKMIRSNTIQELITVTDECEKNKCLFCPIIFTCPQIYSGNSPFNNIVQSIIGMAMFDNWEDILIPISLNHNLTYFPLGGYKRHFEYIEYYSVTYPKTMTFVATPYADSIHEGFTSSTYSSAFTTFAPINDKHPHPHLGATI